MTVLVPSRSASSLTATARLDGRMSTATLRTRRRAKRAARSRQRSLRLSALGLAAAVVMALTSCSMLGGSEMTDQPTRATNLANQRKAAVEFVGPRPEITKVVFSEEGSVGGSGLWAANAVLTVDGKEYQAILGLGMGATSWEPWESPPPGTIPGTVTVVYSDGTSEVLE